MEKAILKIRVSIIIDIMVNCDVDADITCEQVFTRTNKISI